MAIRAPDGANKCKLCEQCKYVSSVSNYTPLHAGRQCWGKTILPGAGYGLGTYRTVDIFNFSHFSLAILEKLRFLYFEAVLVGIFTRPYCRVVLLSLP